MDNNRIKIIINCLIALVFGTGVLLYGVMVYGDGQLTSVGSYGFVHQLSEEAGEAVGGVLMLVGIIFNLLTIKDVKKLWTNTK
ncbi:hypothetical protein M3P05_12900 [Sansalvadorimonas sp. 2012CJ34-2]|uniref:Uncharacterized protein n=1 Tax=Parendozoicomonas callyspongiae TaxID=2942213 RepID=A0ABT0PHG6_9GAMM|nr:hypothetical protein [Sansalvadorimonas sp. 2012CJ34-2]MCL6270822.1 hypothetical protein [Sansalvadorimonas sp. 2012CJ34-2]